LNLYFFHLVDGEDRILDPEGTELTDLSAIARAALTSARSILSAEVLNGRLPLDMRIEVQDSEGSIVHRLPFADAVEILPPPVWWPR
jgi:hypothetical protein